MTLSGEEIEQFNCNGFLVLKNFLEPNICDEIYQKAKYHLDNKIEPFESDSEYHNSSKLVRENSTNYNSNIDTDSIRRLRQVYTRELVFKNWMENKKIRPILQQLLDDQVVVTTAHHNSIMTKLPYVSTETNWHQDRRYWQYSDNNLVSIWLALDAECSENGLLEFIPNSHNVEFDENYFDNKEYFIDISQNKKWITSKVSTNLCKGDVVIFHSLLLHRANRNITNTPKISFVYTVKGSNTKAISGSRSAMFPEVSLEFIK